MPVTTVSDVDDPRLALYAGVGDPMLLRTHGLFVAEGREVVRRLFAIGCYEVVSLFLSTATWRSLEAELTPRLPSLDVFVAERDVFVARVGYNLHRGCLALARRPASQSVDDWLPPAGSDALVVALEGLSDPDNVGVVMRNAHAFGVHGVLLDATCADPLYRKAIRTSTGSSLVVPYARAHSWPHALGHLKQAGVLLAALTPRPDATVLQGFVTQLRAAHPRRVALVLGNEGRGLSDVSLELADQRVRIPMHGALDSINVASAAAIALHALSSGGPDRSPA